MSEFRTTISLQPSKAKITLNDRILTFGSCFSDAIGDRLKRNKFPVLVNPFGTIYNPEALHRLIISAADHQVPTTFAHVRNHDIWLNYDFHSEFSALTEADLNSRIKAAIMLTGDWLQQSDHIMLTYGTAWAYVLRETGAIVSNCHKMPSSLFDKRLQSVEEITASFRLLYARLKKLRPTVRWILTVSPVRHTKDTLPLNAVSKSILRLACHQLSTELEGVEYFPAYEMMLDDLRDYRFYKKDMIHPTEQAEDYIWNAFSVYFSDDTQEFIRKWTDIRRGIEHKPFQPQSSGHKNFLIQLLKKVESLKEIVPVEEEILQIQRSLQQFN
jgi:hypothetical protein